jgi:hypothetical protein
MEIYDHGPHIRRLSFELPNYITKQAEAVKI